MRTGLIKGDFKQYLLLTAWDWNNISLHLYVSPSVCVWLCVCVCCSSLLFFAPCCCCHCRHAVKPHKGVVRGLTEALLQRTLFKESFWYNWSLTCFTHWRLVCCRDLSTVKICSEAEPQSDHKRTLWLDLNSQPGAAATSAVTLVRCDNHYC